MRTDLVSASTSVWPGVLDLARNCWLTTGDVAKILERTPDGVRWLAHHGDLAYEKTYSGQFLFRAGAVKKLVDARILSRVRSREARLAAIRPRMLRVGLEPQQLALDFRVRLRLVGSRSPGRKVA